MYPTVIAILLGSALLSCNESREGATDDSVILEVEDDNINDNTSIDPDTSLTLIDGTQSPVIVDLKDSITMPQQLIDVINNTNDLHPDSILVKKRFEEKGITYYELEFKMEGGRSETFTFDEDGKRRSEDLDK